MSCVTSAIELALRALGIKEGDDVLTQPNSFIATAMAIANIGARPIFADVNNDDYLIDPELAGKALTNKTKCLMPVSLYGKLPTQRLGVVANGKLPLLLDNCQGHGAYRPGLDMYAAMAFSFYPTKNLGSFGDAGAIITTNESIAESVASYRNYGQLRIVKNVHNVVGGNYRMDSIQAAVLVEKLKYLDEWNKQRKLIARLYAMHLRSLRNYVRCPNKWDELSVLPPINDREEHVYHLYVIRVAACIRDVLRFFLHDNNIGTGIHYPTPIHKQKCFYNDCVGMVYPNAERMAAEIISLPIYPGLSEKQICYICNMIGRFFELYIKMNGTDNNIYVPF